METGLTVLVLGAFDICHWGHWDFLLRASEYGEVTVGLSTDDLLAETKRPPIFDYRERKDGLERLGFTVVPRAIQSAIVPFAEVRPNFFVCGSDWAGTTHLEDMNVRPGLLDELETTVVYLPRNHRMSTTRIIEAVKGET